MQVIGGLDVVLAVGEIAEAVLTDAEALDVELGIHGVHEVLAALAVDELAVHVVIVVEQEGQVGDAEHGVEVAPDAVGLERHVDGAVDVGLDGVGLVAVGQLVGAVDVQLDRAASLLLQQLAELLQTDVEVGALGAGRGSRPGHLGEIGRVAVGGITAAGAIAAAAAGNETQRRNERQNKGHEFLQFHKIVLLIFYLFTCLWRQIWEEAACLRAERRQKKRDHPPMRQVVTCGT